MKVYSQLEVASLENLASDPSNLPEGRIWLNTTSGLVKQVIGGVVKTVATADNSLVFSNKTISGATNTINNVPAANIVNTPSGNLAATDVQSALNELQSDIDTRATSSALTTHTSATTSVHGIADTADLLTTSNAKVVTEKDIDGGTASNSRRITIPKDTLANLQALTRKAGTIVFATDTGKQYIDNGTNLIPVGSGSGSKNYFTDGDAEGAMPWSLFNNGVGIWTTGTGGSPTATITTTTSTPLSGQKSFLFTSGTQYDTAKAAITIDKEDTYKIIDLDISYEKASGTYADGDLQLFVYDVTNAKIIYAVPVSNLYSSGIVAKQKFSFQSTDSLSYQLLIHQKTSATFTMKFEMKFGPQVVAGYSLVSSDMVSWTPTFSGTTASNVDFKWSRIGEFMQIIGKFNHNGGGPITFTLPNNATIDSTKISSSNYNTIGFGSISSSNYTLTVLAQGGLQTLAFGLNGPSTSGNSPFPAAWSAELMQFEALVPIQGWSSQASIISQYDGRVVAAHAYVSSNYSTSAGDYVNFDTVVFDTHSCITTGTGTTWKYKAKVAGKYRVSSVMNLSAGTINFQIYKNGAPYRYLLQANTGIQSGDVLLDLIVGDEISIVSVLGAGLAGGTPPICYININMVSGAQQILAGEKIVAVYNNSSTVSGSTSVPWVWANKIIDSHGAFDGTIFSVPRNDYYRITITGATSTGSSTYAYIDKGAGYVIADYMANMYTSQNISTSHMLYLQAGWKLQFRPNTGVNLVGQDGSYVEITSGV